MNWKDALEPIKNSEYFKTLWEIVNNEYAKNKCFPPKKEIFRALELTPFEDVKEDIKNELAQKSYLDFVASLKESAKIEKNDAALKKADEKSKSESQSEEQPVEEESTEN